jgi:hypothetical protein
MGCNHQKQKRVTSMELEKPRVLKLLDVKSLKIDEIATELSNTYGPDAYAPPSIKY